MPSQTAAALAANTPSPKRRLDAYRVVVPSDAPFALEAASNLSPSNWQPLSTNTLTSIPVTITDLDAAKFPQRFYRAVSR